MALRARRRGATYVVFLTTSMLVMLIGLTAVSVARAETRRAAWGDRVAIARTDARSAVDHACLVLSTAAEWRTTIVSGKWVTVSLPSGEAQWKVIDEQDGTFERDQTNPVRVYGRGTSGDAIWVESVLVQPPLTAAGVTALRTELIKNTSFELAVSPWASTYGCDLAAGKTGTESADGGNVLAVSARSQPAAGAAHALPLTLVNGAVYEIRFEMQMASGEDLPAIRIATQGSISGIDMRFETLATSVTTRWTNVVARFTPTWEGTLLDSNIVIGTESTTSDFSIDGVSLRATTPTQYGPIAGTWRRESSDG